MCLATTADSAAGSSAGEHPTSEIDNVMSKVSVFMACRDSPYCIVDRLTGNDCTRDFGVFDFGSQDCCDIPIENNLIRGLTNFD